MYSRALVARHKRVIGFSVRGIMNNYDREEHTGALAFVDANPQNDAIPPLRVQQLQRLDRGIDGIVVHSDALDGDGICACASRIRSPRNLEQSERSSDRPHHRKHDRTSLERMRNRHRGHFARRYAGDENDHDDKSEEPKEETRLLRPLHGGVENNVVIETSRSSHSLNEHATARDVILGLGSSDRENRGARLQAECAPTVTSAGRVTWTGCSSPGESTFRPAWTALCFRFDAGARLRCRGGWRQHHPQQCGHDTRSTNHRHLHRSPDCSGWP
jgi:hypothetical protein